MTPRGLACGLYGSMAVQKLYDAATSDVRPSAVKEKSPPAGGSAEFDMVDDFFDGFFGDFFVGMNVGAAGLNLTAFVGVLATAAVSFLLS